MQSQQKQPLILTLRLDGKSQSFFDAQRSLYFPLERNFLNAHLTIFHQLPDDPATHAYLKDINQKQFAMEVTGLLFLGAGVAYQIVSEELTDLQRQLKSRYNEHLIPQDKQPFRPHITIQNKVKPETAKILLAKLSENFKPLKLTATGLQLWRYLGGPWHLLDIFCFNKLE